MHMIRDLLLSFLPVYITHTFQPYFPGYRFTNMP